MFDTVLQCGNGPRQNPLPGAVFIRQPGELVTFFRKHRHGAFKVVYQPESEPEKHFEAVCRILAEVRDTVFLVDEVWHFTKANYLPEHLGKFVRAYAHYGITLIWTAQCLPDVSTSLRRCTDQWRVFRIEDSRDVAELRGRLPDDALALVPSLPRFTHIFRDEYRNWKVVDPQK